MLEVKQISTYDDIENNVTRPEGSVGKENFNPPPKKILHLVGLSVNKSE